MSLQARLLTRLSSSFTLDVDLSVGNAITILFGASGSGKSTLLRCLAGLTTPDDGRVVVGDDVLFDRAADVNQPPQRRHVGFVFQHLALFPHLSVADNIAYGLDHLPKHERTSRVAALAAAFHIDRLLTRRPGQLSGGERQRVALARTLVTDPVLLLLDEPLAALDHRIQTQIIDDLRAWHATRRIPVLYVTHSHREVFALGERVIALQDGHVVADGTPHQVMDDPGRGDLAQLAGFENLFTGRVTETDATAGVSVVELDTGDHLEVPLFAAAVGATARIAIRAGDVMLAVERPRGISASNILAGEIRALSSPSGTTIRADVHTERATRFAVDVTPRAAVALQLEPGARVWLIIKAYSCRVTTR